MDVQGTPLHCYVAHSCSSHAFPLNTEKYENKNISVTLSTSCVCASYLLSCFSLSFSFASVLHFTFFFTPPSPFPHSHPCRLYLTPTTHADSSTHIHTVCFLTNGGRGNGVGGWTDNRLREEWERCLKLTVVMWVLVHSATLKAELNSLLL